MSIFDQGFVVKKIAPQGISMSSTVNGITFNRFAIEALEKAPFVRFLVNDEKHLLGVQVTTAEDPSAVAFFKAANKTSSSYIRLTAKDLQAEFNSWVSEDLKDSMRVPGTFVEEERHALLFNFSQAVKVS